MKKAFSKEHLWIINHLIDNYDCSKTNGCKACPYYHPNAENVCALDEIKVEIFKMGIDNTHWV